MAGMLLAACLAAAVMLVPDTDAFAKAKVASKSIEIGVNSVYSTNIQVEYSKGDAKINNIKTSSKNLIARQTYQYYHTDAYSYSDHPYGYAQIGVYAKKKGTYTVSFDVCDAKGKKLSSHKVKVTARVTTGGSYVSPFKKVTFAGKQNIFSEPTSKKSGKFKVEMNKGYKLTSIKMRYYDKQGKRVEKTIKNNANVTLGQYAYVDEYQYDSEYDSNYWYYNYNSNLFAETEFYVEYKNTKTKATGSSYFTLYRVPKN